VPTRIAVSIVVPVRNDAATLDRVLAAIRANNLPREEYELIVVDDSSTDNSATIAARYADTVVRLSGRAGGPAYARNRGAELAHGDMVAFVNPDVVVTPSTFERLVEALSGNGNADAAAAARDESAGSANFASQYWNLLRSFGEEHHADSSANLDSGCGIVRRSALTRIGMYDEWRFDSPSLEGLDLGRRLQSSGGEILRIADLKVTYLNRWSFRAICDEVWKRSLTLARSFGYQHMSVAVPGEVVVTLTRAFAPALAVLGSATLTAAMVPRSFVLIRDVGVIVLVLLGNLPVHGFYARKKGVAFALVAAPVHLVIQGVAALALCVGWLLRHAIGDRLPDATTQAFSEVGLQTWPPLPRKI